jgi:glutaredoxin
MRTVTLYTREGCCLCEEARQVLLRLRSGYPESFVLQERDIESSPELHRRYLERIPVVAIDGVEMFELSLDETELQQRLGIVESG